jgi:hypothetical protein
VLTSSSLLFPSREGGPLEWRAAAVESRSDMTEVGGVEARDIARRNGSSSPASSVPGAGTAATGVKAGQPVHVVGLQRCTSSVCFLTSFLATFCC